MSLEKTVYSVLVVSSSESLNSALSDLLPEAKYSPVSTACDISSAKRMTAQRSYDFVLINSPLPDDVGIRFAIDTAHLTSSAVLFFVRSEMHDEIYSEVAEHGVFTLAKPTSRAMLAIALSWLASAREGLRKVEKKTISVEEKMAEIRIVNKAKWLLIEELGMDEPTAHRYIEKSAMDRCVSKREVAEGIIKTYM